ncbi:MAG: hypothetical protein ACREGJ_04405 [Candidatus Saccharimonadales bacterium]
MATAETFTGPLPEDLRPEIKNELPLGVGGQDWLVQQGVVPEEFLHPVSLPKVVQERLSIVDEQLRDVSIRLNEHVGSFSYPLRVRVMAGYRYPHEQQQIADAIKAARFCEKSPIAMNWGRMLGSGCHTDPAAHVSGREVDLRVTYELPKGDEPQKVSLLSNEYGMTNHLSSWEYSRMRFQRKTISDLLVGLMSEQEFVVNPKRPWHFTYRGGLQ